MTRQYHGAIRDKKTRQRLRVRDWRRFVRSVKQEARAIYWRNVTPATMAGDNGRSA